MVQPPKNVFKKGSFCMYFCVYFCSTLERCKRLSIKDWGAIVHLILNNDGHSLKGNSVALHSVSECVLQNLKVVESAIQYKVSCRQRTRDLKRLSSREFMALGVHKKPMSSAFPSS